MKKILVLMFLLVQPLMVATHANDSSWYFQEDTGWQLGYKNSRATKLKCYEVSSGFLVIQQLGLIATKIDSYPLQVVIYLAKNNFGVVSSYFTSFSTPVRRTDFGKTDYVYADTKQVNIGVPKNERFCVWVHRFGPRADEFGASVKIDGVIYLDLALGKVKEIKDKKFIKSVEKYIESKKPD